MFNTELEMSKKFERSLKLNFGNSYLKECQGLFGIPDFVFYSKDKQDVSIISFELKLKDWKRATKQAFRYKSFSHSTYVVLPSKSINSALNNISFFKRYNIGLAEFNIDSEIHIKYKPEFDEPYSENLNKKMIDIIGSSRKKAKNIQFFI